MVTVDDDMDWRNELVTAGAAILSTVGAIAGVALAVVATASVAASITMGASLVVGSFAVYKSLTPKS
jgi:hypothetical protein